jgi:hypothetical protein
VTDKNPSDSPHLTGGQSVLPAPLQIWQTIDWRFLLPAVPIRSVGYLDRVPDDERRALEELGIDVVADTREFDACDVAILTPGPEFSVQEIEAIAVRACSSALVLIRLRQNLAQFWSDFGRRSVKNLRRRLRKQGLETAAYWHAPRRERCSYIVSVDDRLAVDSMLKRYQGVRLGFMKSMLARIVNRAGLVGLIARDLTIVAKRLDDAVEISEPDRQPPILPLRAEQELTVSGREPSRLLVTPWFEASRHVVCLYFDRATKDMCGVAKLPRRPWDLSGIEHEGKILNDVAVLTEGLKDQVPSVRELSFGSRAFLLETPLRGKTAGPETVRADPDRLLKASLAFLERMPVTGDTIDDSAWFQRLIKVPLQQVSAFVALDSVPSLVETTLEYLGPLQAATLPLVLEHGDLSHPNLLLEGDRLAALDWERSELVGLPGSDLFFFLQYVAESRHATFELEGQIVAFDEAFTGRFAWAAPWIRRYMVSIGIDESLFGCLLLATWARSSAGLLARLVPNAQTLPTEEQRTTATKQLADAFTLDRDFALWCHAVRRFHRLLA